MKKLLLTATLLFSMSAQAKVLEVTTGEKTLPSVSCELYSPLLSKDAKTIKLLAKKGYDFKGVIVQPTTVEVLKPDFEVKTVLNLGYRNIVSVTTNGKNRTVSEFWMMVNIAGMDTMEHFGVIIESKTSKDALKELVASLPNCAKVN